jgi:putative ABC transport system permease protein
VVGVVGDVHQWGPEQNPVPEVFFSLSVLPSELEFLTKTVKYLVVRTDLEPLGVVPSIRHEVAQVDPNQPISDIRTTAAILDEALARRRFNTLLIGIFAAIGLVLVGAGIYGVMSFFVAQRTHEIGVRMAMGARWSSVQTLVLGQALKLATVGVPTGLVGVFATVKLTESMVYGISPTDPVTVAGGTLFLVVVGVLGSLVPAWRATRVDPIQALRAE